jgi:RHS repeat-associated protein
MRQVRGYTAFRMSASLHRSAVLLFAGLTLFPTNAFAAAIPPITAQPETLTVVDTVADQNMCPLGQGTDPLNGVTGTSGQQLTLVNGSPALIGAPTYNSKQTTKTVWGLGWSDDIDQYLTIVSSQSITWTQASGQQLTFFNANPSTAPAPSYVAPVNVYEKMTVLTASNAVPTSIAERDKDGTTRIFAPYGTSPIFRLSQLKDRNGNTITYARNSFGNLTQATDVHGRYLQVTYAGGYVATLADSGGRSVSYAYDGQGRRTSETGPQGTTTYSYNPQNQLSQIKYPNGSIHEYVYDGQGRVVIEDDGNGVNKRTYAYGASGTTVTDALGNPTVYTSTSSQGLSVPLQMTDADNGVTSFAYDANLNMTKLVDPLGHATQYGYDGMGNVTQAIDAAGGQASASYNQTYSFPTQTTDPLGHQTQFAYDAAGDLTLLTDPLSHMTKLAYDGYGHATQITDALGLATNNTYSSSNGALASTTDPLSHTTTLTTDALSRVTQNTDALSHSTQYSYDAANDLTQVTDALSHATNYGYAAGRNRKLLSTVTDANSHTTSFAYDAQARLTSVTDALSHTKSSSYDAASNLVKTVNGRGQTITYGYDKLNRLISKTTPEGTLGYVYDAVGNMTSAGHYNGSSLQMTYDALNRVTQVVQKLPSGYSATIGYGYDANGNRTSMTTPWGSFSYTYDALNRLTSVTNPQSNTFTFSYDADSRRTQMTAPNGVTTSYTYDNASRITSIVATNGGGVVVSSESYVYDAVGNRTSMTDVEGTHSYTYDNIYRLTQAQHPAGTSLPISTETFSYDPVGNRLADAAITGYTYDAANELTSNSSYTYTSDADGNQTSKTDLSSNVTTYSFDSRNELTGVALPGGTNWTYQYDARYRRISESSGTAASQGIQYIYDGQNILAMLDNSNNLVDVFTNGLSIDEPLLMHTAGGSDYVYSADALGSIRAITNSGGSVVESYKYLAYGLPLIQGGSGNMLSESSIGNTFLFATRAFNVETGLYENRNRYYEPSYGRFLGTDPIGIAGGINLYEYASSRPTRSIDPYGLQDMDYTYGSNPVNPSGNTDFQSAFAQFAQCVAENSVSNIVTGASLATTAVPKQLIGEPTLWNSSPLTTWPAEMAVLLKRWGLIAQNSQIADSLQATGRTLSPIMTPVTVAEGGLDIAAIALCLNLVNQNPPMCPISKNRSR